MPIYDYHCKKCELDFNIVESIHDHKYPSRKPCPKCKRKAPQKLSCNIHFTGTKVEDAYRCPALGQVIKSKYQRNEAAKKLDLIEIGNEKTDTVHKHFDSRREEKFKKAYDDII